eukprot:scaffold13527_cov202-Amphora_coffeaeformis.AAC.4
MQYWFFVVSMLAATASRSVHGFTPLSGAATTKPFYGSLQQKMQQDDAPRLMNGGLLREDSIETDEFVSESTLPYQVPDDPVCVHLAMLILATFPWYLYTAYEMVTVPDVDFFGLSHPMITALGLYVAASQVGVYTGCWRLAQAPTLAKAQGLVGILTCLCIPADVIGTLYVPTGSLGITVLAFAAVTTFFGIFLAHYLRKAAYRQVPPVVGHHAHYDTVWETLRHYQPAPHHPSTHLAMEFTRGFVSFTISLRCLRKAVMPGTAKSGEIQFVQGVSKHRNQGPG